jgi:hypothetical protein
MAAFSCGTASKVFENYKNEVVRKNKIYVEVDSVKMLVDSSLLEKLSIINSSLIKTNIEEGLKLKNYIVSDSNSYTIKLKVSKIDIIKDNLGREFIYNNKKGNFYMDTLILGFVYFLYDSAGNQIDALNLNTGLGEDYKIKEKMFGVLTSLAGSKEWDKGSITQNLMVKHLGFSKERIQIWSNYIGYDVPANVIKKLKGEYLKNKNIKLSFFNNIFFYSK